MGVETDLMESVLSNIPVEQRSIYSIEADEHGVTLREGRSVVAGMRADSITHTITVIGEAAVIGGFIDVAVRNALSYYNYHLKSLEGYEDRFFGYIADRNGILLDIHKINLEVKLRSPEKVGRN